jgi:DNA-binding XRE family transcriptional regulator
LNIKDLRKKKFVSQEHLAKVIGVTKQSISRYENEGALPQGEALKKLIEFFELDINEVMETVAAQSAASEPPARYNTDSGTHPLLEQYRVLLESQQRMVEAQAKTIDTLNGVIDRLTSSITPQQ